MAEVDGSRSVILYCGAVGLVEMVVCVVQRSCPKYCGHVQSKYMVMQEVVGQYLPTLHLRHIGPEELWYFAPISIYILWLGFGGGLWHSW